jgi:two-component system, NtrC family, response regulator GlrR
MDPAVQTNLVGNSPAFLDVLRLITRMASCDATVLVQGETGTGKELAARAIHYLGLRRHAPFIAVNCGALPETLVESELFGHARGAFTDAREARAGVVAQAEGGTLFLDEVQAMGPHAQVALLRFLQEREYRPVGGTLVRGADVRVVASTNSDLGASGTFRSDLLFRLNILPVVLPPLRERGGDAVLLAQTFLRRFSRQYQRPPKTLDADSQVFLERHSWPGNVRELENLIHRHFLLSDADVIHFVPGAAATAPRPASPGSFREAKARAIADFERQYITSLLAQTNGNISMASRLSGKERSRLCKLVKKYGLAGRFRPSPVALPPQP